MANSSPLCLIVRIFRILKPRVLITIIFIFAGFSETCLANTDLVTFANGNRLVGELKNLERGKLSFKTDATGTLSIEWDDITTLVSDQSLQFEVTSGQRHLGQLVNSSETGKLSLKTDDGIIFVPIVSVIRIFPIENVLRERIDGSIRAGFNFKEASDVAISNLGIDAKYRTEKRVLSAKLNSNVTVIDGETTQMQDFNLYIQGLRENNRFTGGIFQIQKNDELGTDLRTSIGGGFGRYLKQTNSKNISIFGGLLVSVEHTKIGDPVLLPEDIVIDTDDKETQLEGVLSLSYDWFRFDEPEFDVHASLKIFPNISDIGRVRSELDLVFRWELVHDLFWQMDFYDRFDTGVPDMENSSNDYGVNTSFGYEF